MAHPSKAKGDRAEREAVAVLLDKAGDLCLPHASRQLGAGRRDDIGDLRVFTDVTIQVKAYRQLLSGLRSAAGVAEAQRIIAGQPFAVGLSPIPRAPVGVPSRLRWLASAVWWPDPGVASRAACETFTVNCWADALAQLTDPADLATRPFDTRITEIVRNGTGTILVGAVDAWLADYRRATAGGVAGPPTGRP